jgi:hypothetical protein
MKKDMKTYVTGSVETVFAPCVDAGASRIDYLFKGSWFKNTCCLKNVFTISPSIR